ncbi:uncharacterized protein LOC129299438 [Prosopis cineraria]|uniref:uncharacterized protein LOC129299438 n=1 Tax=Prosopis cineraria TaxID=364024 RepID=UPI00241075E0|nr:uncharacterized protein LOC129299438 [Prosopis cineraria]
MQNGRSLDDFLMMPKPECSINYDNVNNLMMEGLSFDIELYISKRYRFEQQLTVEQREIYEKILSTMNSKEGSFFFVYGFGGTGKTFLWNALTAFIRSQKRIVLNVASSGIATTLLPSGRTAHSQFCIPINVTEDSTCNIVHGSSIATLIQNTNLIVWDEAPMVKKHCVEAFNRTIKDIMHDDRIFGGKVVVFGGEAITYFSSDSVCKTDYSSDSFDDIYDTEFLNTIEGSRLASHKLTLKVGVPIMLMRNIDQANGLCNGTRLRVTLLRDHFIKGIILNGSKPGEEVYIHQMDLNPYECNLPFQMKRR